MKQTALQNTSSTIRFRAELLRPDAADESGPTSVLVMPNGAGVELPSRGLTMVEGTINGFPFRAALEPGGDNGCRLQVSKAQQNAAGACFGDMVTVEITRVDEEPEIRVPLDLLEALVAARAAQELWERITPMARREWIRWVASAKQEETRARRIENGIDMLAHGKRRPCCFPGVNWVTKDLVIPDETWLPLPDSKNGRSPKST
jgi:hypothetical protein